jgi:exosortase
MESVTAQCSEREPVLNQGESRAPTLGLIEEVRLSLTGPDRMAALLTGANLAALIALYWNSLTYLVWTWSNDENYGHGFLVPLISLYFANETARRSWTETRRTRFWGPMLLGLSVVGKLVTTLVPIGMVADISFLLGVAGVLAMAAGDAALRRFRFPLFFLIFMIPLPIAVYSAVASPLQALVSRIASSLLNFVGIPVLSQGNMMTLPGGLQLFVAEACSGMRQLTGFLALSTAVAWLWPRAIWLRAVLVLSSVPIALAANVLRVALTAWIAYSFNPELTRGWLHTVEGLLMMGVGLLMLAGECALLGRLSRPVVNRVSPVMGVGGLST